MLFNSFIFLVFGALFFALLYFIRRTKRPGYTWGFLVLASFIFYGWWDWRFLFLILASGFIDYFGALGIHRFPKRRKLFLLLSLLGNVGSLAVFKYSGFIAENLDSLFEALGIASQMAENIPEFMLILPVGISFYTFQSMSYTIDVYRDRLKPTRNVLHFFAYLSLFPQLVAGPIVRARDLMPQLKKLRPTTEVERWNGFKLIIIGFFKKVVLADNIAPMVNSGFANIHATDNGPFWWIMIIGFAFQIYFDFSGYSDMAIGLGLMFGFVFAKNFDSPYHSASITEFWRRWHISLSTWLKQYLYIPLGGNRKGTTRTAINLGIVMLLGGLWHGASWNFVVWGGLHGLLLGAERSFGRRPVYFFLPRSVRIVVTFILVLITWVFFRAETFSGALLYLGSMFGLVNVPQTSLLLGSIIYTPYSLWAMGIAAIIVWRAPQTWDWSRKMTPLKVAGALLLFATSIAVLSMQSYNPFIYFNF
jgi:alginate O-acetyltransferase complex protein AlgI